MAGAGKGKLAEHCQALVECRLCRHNPGIVPVVGRAAVNTSPRVMLVGQAPGQMEAEGGRPFAGRAGKTLFKWFDQAGLDEDTARRKIYIAAVTRCYPGPHPSGRGDRVPSPREQDACAAWLESELRIIRPKLLIPVGKLAIARFLPDQPLDELIGRAHEVEHVAGKSVVIPLPHPSGASSWIYQGDHPKLLERALRILASELRKLGVIAGDTRSVA